MPAPFVQAELVEARESPPGRRETGLACAREARLRTGAGRVLLAALFLALGACRSVPLASDPTVPGSVPGPPAIFAIDWWVRLVAPPMWEYAPRETAQPAVDFDTGRIIVLTRDGYVRSVSPENGKVEWEFKTLGPFNAGALLREGIAYVPGGDGTLYALRLGSGELVWKYPSGEELATTPVFSGGKVLVASQSDTLFAVDAASGKWVWQYRRDAPSGFTIRGAAAPRVDSGVAYIGFSDGTIVAVTVADGTAKWERSLTTSGGHQFLDADATPVLDDAGRLFVASYKDGVYSLDANTGEVQWHTARAGVTSLLPRGDVLVTAGDGQMGALLSTDGKPLWSLDLEARAARQPLLAHGLLVVPTNGALTFVDPSTGRARESWNPGKGVSATPGKAQNRLYVLSNLGLLYAMRLVGRGG